VGNTRNNSEKATRGNQNGQRKVHKSSNNLHLQWDSPSLLLTRIPKAVFLHHQVAERVRTKGAVSNSKGDATEQTASHSVQEIKLYLWLCCSYHTVTRAACNASWATRGAKFERAQAMLGHDAQ